MLAVVVFIRWSWGDRMSFVPLSAEVEVYTVGEPVVDRFGNERPGVGGWQSVKVAQWWVHKSEESEGDSIRRLIDVLTVHAPLNTPITTGGKFRLPDGSEWTVEGNAEDYNHGWHGWKPELLVFHGEKVTG